MTNPVQNTNFPNPTLRKDLISSRYNLTWINTVSQLLHKFIHSDSGSVVEDNYATTLNAAQVIALSGNIQKNSYKPLELQHFNKRDSYELVEIITSNHVDVGDNGTPFETLSHERISSVEPLETNSSFLKASIIPIEFKHAETNDNEAVFEYELRVRTSSVQPFPLEIRTANHTQISSSNIKIEIRHSLIRDGESSIGEGLSARRDIKIPLEKSTSEAGYGAAPTAYVASFVIDGSSGLEETSNYRTNLYSPLEYAGGVRKNSILFSDLIGGFIIDSLVPDAFVGSFIKDSGIPNAKASDMMETIKTPIEMLHHNHETIPWFIEFGMSENSDGSTPTALIGNLNADTRSSESWYGNLIPNIGKLYIEFGMSENSDVQASYETNSSIPLNETNFLEVIGGFNENFYFPIETNHSHQSVGESARFQLEIRYSEYGVGSVGFEMSGISHSDSFQGTEENWGLLSSTKNLLEWGSNEISDTQSDTDSVVFATLISIFPSEIGGGLFENTHSPLENELTAFLNEKAPIELGSSSAGYGASGVEENSKAIGDSSTSTEETAYNISSEKILYESVSYEVADVDAFNENNSNGTLNINLLLDVGGENSTNTKIPLEFEFTDALNQKIPLESLQLEIGYGVSFVENFGSFISDGASSLEETHATNLNNKTIIETISGISTTSDSPISMGTTGAGVFIIPVYVVMSASSDGMTPSEELNNPYRNLLSPMETTGNSYGAGSIPEEFSNILEKNSSVPAEEGLSAYGVADNPLEFVGNTVSVSVSSMEVSASEVGDAQSYIAFQNQPSVSGFASAGVEMLGNSVRDASVSNEFNLSSILARKLSLEIQYNPSGLSKSGEEWLSLGTSWIVNADGSIPFEMFGTPNFTSNTMVLLEIGASDGLVNQTPIEVGFGYLSNLPVEMEVWNIGLGADYLAGILDPIGNLLSVPEDVRTLEVPPDSPGIMGNLSMSIGVFSSMAPNSSDRFGFSYIDWLETLPGDTVVAQPVVIATPAGLTVTSVAYNAGIVSWWMASSSIQGKFTISVSLTTLGGRVCTKQAQILILPD